jgi:endonuclease/exonuclease/phosphatase family metal-dependent hydrolase
MSKHASRQRRGGSGATIATIAVVGLLTVVVSVLAIFRHDAAGPDTAADAAADSVAATQRPSTTPSTTPRPTHPATHAASRSPKPQKVDKVGKELRQRTQRVVETKPATSSFRVGTLNILGSNHTRGGHGRYGAGTTRAGISTGLIESRGIDIVGLQEVQDDQLVVLDNQLDGYGIWPMQTLGNNSQRLQIAWRDSQFELVDAGSVSYVFASQRIPLPWVRLRDEADGAEFFVITTHNSAGGLEGERDAATGVEIALINQLRATGLPVLITGDMNEHEEFFCRVATSAGMVAANGGSGSGGCVLPPMPRRVDWIMGTTDVDFSGYVQDGASLARASDHYLLYADAALTNPPPTGGY